MPISDPRRLHKCFLDPREERREFVPRCGKKSVELNLTCSLSRKKRPSVALHRTAEKLKERQHDKLWKDRTSTPNDGYSSRMLCQLCSRTGPTTRSRDAEKSSKHKRLVWGCPARTHHETSDKTGDGCLRSLSANAAPCESEDDHVDTTQLPRLDNGFYATWHRMKCVLEHSGKQRYGLIMIAHEETSGCKTFNDVERYETQDVFD